MAVKTKEYKQLSFETKVDTEKRIVKGYASTFGNRDLVGDVVEPGAFKKTIQESGLQGGGFKTKFLYQHWEPLGTVLHMEEDSKGLYVEGRLSKHTLGNDVLELVNDKVIDTFSIGYDVLQDDYKADTNTRHLKELKLYEFSLVLFPANPEAGVTGMKNFDMLNNALKNTANMDVTRLLKEGRKLSSSNEQLIRDAITALQNVLEIAEPEQDENEKSLAATLQTHEKPLLDTLQGIDQKELQDILNSFKLK